MSNFNSSTNIDTNTQPKEENTMTFNPNTQAQFPGCQIPTWMQQPHIVQTPQRTAQMTITPQQPFHFDATQQHSSIDFRSCPQQPIPPYPFHPNNTHQQLDWTGRGFIPNPNLQAPQPFYPNGMQQQPQFGIKVGYYGVFNMNTSLRSKDMSQLSEYVRTQSDTIAVEYLKLFEYILKATSGLLSSDKQLLTQIEIDIMEKIHDLDNLIHYTNGYGITFISDKLLDKLTEVGCVIKPVNELLYQGGELSDRFITENTINSVISNQTEQIKDALEYYKKSKNRKALNIACSFLGYSFNNILTKQVCMNADEELLCLHLEYIMETLIAVNDINPCHEPVIKVWNEVIKNKVFFIRAKYAFVVFNSTDFSVVK